MRIKFLSMVLIFCLVPAAFAEPAANAPELKNEFMDLCEASHD